MKRFLLTLVVIGITMGLNPIIMNAQNHNAYMWTGNPDLVRTDIGGLLVSFPKDCKYSEELSKQDDGNFTWITPDKRFMFICCLFNTEEGFHQEDRLIGEAAEIGLEVTGDGDIANMKLSEDKYLSFSFNEKIGVGVCHLFPESQVGVCLFVIMKDASKENSLIADVLGSIRLSEK